MTSLSKPLKEKNVLASQSTEIKNVDTQSDVATRFNYGSIVHEDHHVSFVQKFNAVGAEDSGLPS